MLDLDRVINKLISLTENKYKLLVDLLTLTIEQTEVIEARDIDGLNLLIDRKQEKLDIINQLDIQFEAIVGDLKTLYDVNSLDALEIKCFLVTNLISSIEKVMDKLREISNVEQINKEKMLIAKEELQEKICNASRGKNAISQYGAFGSYADACFIDRKIK